MKRILITGAEGLVGSACFSLFNKAGWEVLGIDNDMRSYFFGTIRKNPKNNVDIRDEETINEIFSVFRPDAIIHAAAQPSHDWAQQEPLTDFDVNARATLVLLEATRKYTPKAVFIYVSTDKVYGENMFRKLKELSTRYHSDKPFKEDLGLDFAGQRSLFGCSKTAGDIYAQEYANYFGLKIGIFRPGCITGKNHAAAEQHGFLAYLVKCIKEGNTYKIYGYKGKQVRDQIHAYDLATAFQAFIENPKVGAVYNIGGGPERSISILEAGKMIRNFLNDSNGCVWSYSFYEKRKGDRQWDVHDISKFRKDYPGWDYKYSLDDIMKDLCIG